MIRFERVSKTYPGGCRALADVSFEIERGSMVFLTGHSGAGKSTLLRLVMMLDSNASQNPKRIRAGMPHQIAVRAP